VQGRLFAAASESVALANLGFTDVKSLKPGEMAVVEDGRLRFEQFAPPNHLARCFFEWVYFSNVASQIDGCNVYNARAATGVRLAQLEDQPLDEDSIVVPVPDTAKAAADAFAFKAGIQCVEGIIRNRYVGRTFIQSDDTRSRSVEAKYTPLKSVMGRKRVFLLEDSIVRSTTLRALAHHIRQRGMAKEIHVRVACPPIISPCFYGIDMSTLGELFAPGFAPSRYNGRPSAEMQAEMAKALGVDSLRYLNVSDLAPCIGCEENSLCRGCVTGKYPTNWGNRLMRRAKRNLKKGLDGRTY